MLPQNRWSWRAVLRRFAVLLPVVTAVGCAGRTPEFSYATYGRPQFADVNAFFACREIRRGGAIVAVVPDYVGTIESGGGILGFYDIFHLDHQFEIPVARSRYDVFCLRARDGVSNPDAVSCVLVRGADADPVRWEALPDFLGTDCYDLTIATPPDAARLEEWVGEGGFYDAVLARVVINWSSTTLPDRHFSFNAMSRSRAIVIYCGKALRFFKGVDAAGHTVAIMVNVV